MRARLQQLLARARGASVPRHSWSVFHPNVHAQVLHPVERLAITRPPHLTLVQTYVHRSKLEETIMRWGLAFAMGSAMYQFVTNLHSVPITGRTQVVAVSPEEEVEMGIAAAKDGLQNVKTITAGPRFRMCVDVVSRLVGVSEHLFPRAYDWRIWLVDAPNVANACCYPGGKIIIYTGILDVIDAAVEKHLVANKHDALAVIVAHEIAHALARHAAERMSYLPTMYLQMILGYESPLLQYFFQFAMNLPFSRVQEMEADHIGIMLMAQACYDPRVAPKFWRAFGSQLDANTNATANCYELESDLELDFFSTHPSHKKRERRLETLVDTALELQRRASWCFQVKERVQQMLDKSPTVADSAFLQRVQSVRQHVALPPRRRNTVGTIHEMENEEILRGLLGEQERQRQQTTTAPTTSTSTGRD